jgi:FtsP/CotA-like multicopper oxidase with cupredoxin domain
MRHSLLVAGLLGLASVVPPNPTSRGEDVRPPLAGRDDYRRGAGRRIGDTLFVTLDVQQVTWRPEAGDGPQLTVFAFVERGMPVRVPGPMLRVPSGTVIRTTLHNASAAPVAVFGLQDHAPGKTADSVVIASGADEIVTFRATSPGSYYYWGRTRAPRSRARLAADQSAGGSGADGPFVGPLIVDPPGQIWPQDERVLLITRWYDVAYKGIGNTGNGGWKMMVNGASWPHTERLEYTEGDTIRWRVLNATGVQHPMHLHGFYFDVTARGDNRLDTLYTANQRRAAVTELMQTFSTMSLTWIADRPGNWLFHCHFIRHIEPSQRILDSATVGDEHGAHGTAPLSADHRAGDHMAGLVVGLAVRPRQGRAGAASLARATGMDRPARHERAMRLVATTRPRVFGDAPGYSFVLQEGAIPPAADSMRVPGTPLILTRGEPTRITVVNQSGSPLSVHWHGMELESWFDGVGGWSGSGTKLRPPITPSDSFAVRMTPHRAGTFIYHTHDETGDQLGSGLYGALLVVEPGAKRDTTRDHLIVAGLLGPNLTASLAINGMKTPAPITLLSGVAHRLRFVSIPASERVLVELVRSDSVVQSWRPLASDGADLPGVQRVTRPARVQLSAGQTFDVEIRLDPAAAASGTYALRFRTTFYGATARQPEVTMLPIITQQ